MSHLREAIHEAAERAADAAVARLGSGPFPIHEYLNTRQAAAYLGLSVARLEIWRCRGGGPPFIRVTSRIIRYRRPDLDAWMSAHERRPQEKD